MLKLQKFLEVYSKTVNQKLCFINTSRETNAIGLADVPVTENSQSISKSFYSVVIFVTHAGTTKSVDITNHKR
jgi:hypothetical protein